MNRVKVLLLGKSGMLGSNFLTCLAGWEDFEMYAYDRNTLNISDFDELNAVFKRISPDFVINCSAFTAVDDCEVEKEKAFKVNADSVKEIAKVCKRENAILVHFSTDYVFDGKKKEGYNEDDAVAPINVYGESKLKGEEFLKENTDEYYLVRTSWLFGPNGKNFVDTMIKMAKEKDSLDIVDDQIGCPTYTKDLCDAVINYFLMPYLGEIERQHEYQINEKPIYRKKLDFGVYHLTNTDNCSWFEFAKEIFKITGQKVNVKAINSEKLSRPALRPAFSILKNNKLPSLRSWKIALKDYIEMNFSKENLINP